MNSLLLPELTPLQRRKRAAILKGAKAVFLREGFGLATMDDVAAAVVSSIEKGARFSDFGKKDASERSYDEATEIDERTIGIGDRFRVRYCGDPQGRPQARGVRML